MPDISFISNEECMEIVRNHLKTSEFRIIDVSYSPLEKENRGLLGEHYKINITVNTCTDSKDFRRTLNYFLKKKPQDDSLYTVFVEASNSYEKETFFFDTLLPLLRKHLRGSPEEVSTLSFVTSVCYYTRPDLVVLEDLVAQGFYQLEKRTLLNYEQCLSMLKTLARFHAASIIFEEKESSSSGNKCCLGDMFPILQEDTFFGKGDDHVYSQAVTAGVRAMAALVELSAKYGRGTPHHELVQSRLDATMRSFFDQLRPSDSERNVVCHRDLWLNNVLFLGTRGITGTAGDHPRSEDGGLSCRLVDMQLIVYCPPAVDLMMLLYLNTVRPFRLQHEASLLDGYYSELSAHLRRHDLDAQHLLPRAAFQASCDKARRVGVLLGACYCPVSAYEKYAADYDIYDFIVRDRTKQTSEAYVTDPQYRKRIDDVIEEMVERYIL